jgi:hypothetical protein
MSLRLQLRLPPRRAARRDALWARRTSSCCARAAGLTASGPAAAVAAAMPAAAAAAAVMAAASAVYPPAPGGVEGAVARPPSNSKLLCGGEQRGTHCVACLAGRQRGSALDPPASAQLPLATLRLLLPLPVRVEQGGRPGDNRLQALSHAALVVLGWPGLEIVTAVEAFPPVAACLLSGQASGLHHGTCACCLGLACIVAAPW